MRATLRSQNQLEALLEDELQFEPVREEVFRELIELYDYETNHGLRVRDCARKAADAVGRAIKRFHQHLATSTGPDGQPHPVLRAFADHLKQFLLVPSGRDGNHGGARARRGSGGCFNYQPPTGVRWLV